MKKSQLKTLLKAGYVVEFSVNTETQTDRRVKVRIDGNHLYKPKVLGNARTLDEAFDNAFRWLSRDDLWPCGEMQKQDI